MRKYLFPYDPFGRAFVENSEKTVNEQIALALLESAKYRPIDFPENCMLPTVGAMPEGGASYYIAGTGVAAEEAEYTKLIAAHPECAKELSEIRDIMLRESTANRSYYENVTRYEENLINAFACWGGRWIGHANPDYDRVLHMGTNGIRELIEKCRSQNPGKDFFYDSAKTVMDAIDVIGDRILQMAQKNSKTASTEKLRHEWARIEKAFHIIPRKPAYDMFSAVQMFWLFFTFDGTDSPGRIDQCMIDYYRASSPEESEEMITRMLEAIHNVRAWNLCISGSDENWNDETNELSYLILRRVTEMGYQTPNLTMRVHRNTPEKLWRMAIDCIATGIGLPALYNDEVVCPALESIGIPPCDSHDYCMNGCNQIDIMGKSHMGLEDGEVNFAKALELTLHDGYDYAAEPPKILAHRFGDPRKCATFEEFMSLYTKMLYHITDVAINVANRCQEAYAYFAPSPLRSCTIQGCLEKGLDYKMGGPLYGHGQILSEGIADTADSLWAIKTLIYDQKRYTMNELIDSLSANFVGYEKLHAAFSGCEKFGNDIEELDALCGKMVNDWFAYLRTKHTFRGGVYMGGCSPFNRAAENGSACAALPNGKRKGASNFADSIAATPGCDLCGPTASARSMLHYDHDKAGSGFVAQFKFAKSFFCTDLGKDVFLSFAKVYFAGGGQQLSINVVDRETLLTAQKEPEKYASLIVRVGGYSEYFKNLTPELQQNVIDRSEHTL